MIIDKKIKTALNLTNLCTMGGKSSVNIETINKTLTETVMKVSKTCAAAAVNKISLSADEVGGDVVIGGKIKQNAKATLNCDQKSDIAAAIKSEMASAIQAQSAVQSNSLLEGSIGIYSEASSNMKTVNENIMKMNIDDIMKCQSNSENEFKVAFGNIKGNFTFESEIDQTAGAEISQCIQDSGIDMDLAGKVNNDLAASAKHQGLMGTMLDGLGNIMGSIVLIAIAMAVIGLVSMIAMRLIKGKPPVTAKRTGIWATLLGTATNVMKSMSAASGMSAASSQVSGMSAAPSDVSNMSA